MRGERQHWDHQRPGIAWVGSALVALALTLSGCANTAPTDPAAVTSETSGESSESSAGEAVPAGFPDGFDCAAVAELIPEFTAGLYLNGSRVEPEESYDRELSCSWSDVPLDTMIPSLDDKTTELDVIVQVDLKDVMDANYRDSWCDQVRGQAAAADAALDGHGQCGSGTLVYERGSGGLGAWVPYFDLRLDVSCNLSTDCVPQLPESFTDEAGFAALRTLADHLAANLRFKEPVIVSDADNEADFVRDWGDAGFPTLEDAPDWYCHPALYDTISDYVLRLQGAGVEGDFTWEVSDEVNRKPAIPEVRLTQSGGGVPGPDENGAWETSVTIQVVLGNSNRCISGIEHAAAG